MKIGVDARFLTHPQLGGFKSYTVNLISALSQIDSVNQYVLYLDRLPLNIALPEAENFTYRVAPLTMPGFGMPVREQVTLRRLIAEDKSDIVHFLCNTAPIKIAQKFIVTLHDTIQVTNTQPFRIEKSLAEYRDWGIKAYSKWSISKTARAADCIITVSNSEKAQISHDLHIAPDKIFVTHLAPSPIFTPASEETKKEWGAGIRQKCGIRNKFILGIGYEPRKCIPDLINAFSAIASNHPDVDLVLVVAQEEKRLIFQHLASERKISDRVITLPGVLPTDLVVLYNLAEVFVFPSERESFGLPPLEAMACGTPVVAANGSSIPEIVEKAALLVGLHDEGELARTMSMVLNDESLRNDLTAKGLARVAQFSWKTCALQTIEIYKQAVLMP